MNGAYLMLIPDRLVIQMMDFVRKNDDVIIFRAQNFLEVYHDILYECSVANASVEADGSLGQG